MRPDAEYEEAMRWIHWGLNPYEISRLTSLPHTTIQNWKQGRRAQRITANPCPRCGSGKFVEGTYAYLLGLYFGDGYIVRQHRKKAVYRLSITQDENHIGLIGECAHAIRSFVQPVGPNVGFVQQGGCIDIVSFWQHWPCVFPQHGPGRKDQRSMKLLNWQRRIADAYPKELLRGLIHSDGCRYENVVGRQRRDGGYRYVNYMFTNASEDIRCIFTESCDRLGIAYRAWRRDVTISRRGDVEALESFVGPKH